MKGAADVMTSTLKGIYCKTLWLFCTMFPRLSNVSQRRRSSKAEYPKGASDTLWVSLSGKIGLGCTAIHGKQLTYQWPECGRPSIDHGYLGELVMTRPHLSSSFGRWVNAARQDVSVSLV